VNILENLMKLKSYLQYKYCHVSRVLWWIVTGSELDDWIYWHLLLQSLLFTINYSATTNPPILQITRTHYHFPAMDLTQKLSLQITMQSSCHFLFNHLGVPTLQNLTKFSNANSLIQFSHQLLATDSRHIDSAWTTENMCYMSDCLFIGPLPALCMAWTTEKKPLLLSSINTRHQQQQKTQPLYCCVTSLHMSECV
jgi:hypothetical protein